MSASLSMVFGRPFVKQFALCYQTIVLTACLSVTLAYCGQTAGWIKMPLGLEVGLGPVDFVLDWNPAPSPQKGGGAPPQILADVYCGQTAGWIKMALGMEVGLRSGEFVLDGDPASPPQKRQRSSLPNFRPISIVAKRLDASRCHLVWR